MGDAWSVEVAVRSSPVGDDAAEALLEELGGPDTVIAFMPPDRMVCSFMVASEHPVEAAHQAVLTISRALKSVGLRAKAPVVGIRVALRADEIREAKTRTFPELLGVSELRTLLGVSRQRIAELRRESWFPRPIVEISAGPVWTRPSIEQFIEHWKRKPGRPPRARAASR